MTLESFREEVQQILGETFLGRTLWLQDLRGAQRKIFGLQPDGGVPKAGTGGVGRIDASDREVSLIRKPAAAPVYLG